MPSPYSMWDEETAMKKSAELIEERILISRLTNRNRAAIDCRLDAYSRAAEYGGVA